MSAPAIPAWLTADIVPLAWCWRIARSDGVVLGFTSHDRDLDRNGTRYRAAPGMVPSAITLSGALTADSLDIKGALTSDAVTEEDLDAGRWDGARLWLHAVNWEDAREPMILVAEGELGAIDRQQRGFTAELRGVVARLDAAIVPATSPDCRAELGDKDCRVDTSALTRRAIVTKAEGARLHIDGATAAHGLGRLRFLEGALAGTELPIYGAGDGWVDLARRPPAAVAVGTRVRLGEGCDKMFTTCCNRFSNAANFRGEPHLPGMDYLTRYPGAG